MNMQTGYNDRREGDSHRKRATGTLAFRPRSNSYVHKKDPLKWVLLVYGERGIRTPGPVLPDNAFREHHLRPLGHLS